MTNRLKEIYNFVKNKALEKTPSLHEAVKGYFGEGDRGAIEVLLQIQDDISKTIDIINSVDMDEDSRQAYINAFVNLRSHFGFQNYNSRPDIPQLRSRSEFILFAVNLPEIKREFDFNSNGVSEFVEFANDVSTEIDGLDLPDDFRTKLQDITQQCKRAALDAALIGPDLAWARLSKILMDVARAASSEPSSKKKSALRRVGEVAAVALGLVAAANEGVEQVTEFVGHSSEVADFLSEAFHGQVKLIEDQSDKKR